MALLEIFGVLDNAVGAFSRPFFVPARGAAIRSFIDECGNSQSELYKHPSDYTLWYLGSFDEATGLLVAKQPAEQICRALDFVDHGPLVPPRDE